MDSFDIRKKEILKKVDKSSKGSWDLKIKPLCDRLNLLKDYYTTSSCSGKAVIMPEKVGRDGTYYLWTSHELLNFEELKKIILNLKRKNVLKFKLEGPILFVVCRDLNLAKELLWKVKDLGFKQSGINITEKLIGVEIKSGEKLEFPLIKDGTLLVEDDFLKEIVLNANFKLERGWKKIEKMNLLF